MSCLIPREEQQVTDLQVNKTLNVDADKMDYLVINTSGEKSNQAIDERKIQTACYTGEVNCITSRNMLKRGVCRKVIASYG
jgi:hypothetical protein